MALKAIGERTFILHQSTVSSLKIQNADSSLQQATSNKNMTE